MNARVVEKSILHYTNRERTRRGLKKLKGQPSLIRAARGHSRWMARRNRYSHTGGGGSQPQHRVQRAGYVSVSVGENIWRTSGSSGLAWHSKIPLEFQLAPGTRCCDQLDEQSWTPREHS